MVLRSGRFRTGSSFFIIQKGGMGADKLYFPLLLKYGFGCLVFVVFVLVRFFLSFIVDTDTSINRSINQSVNQSMSRSRLRLEFNLGQVRGSGSGQVRKRSWGMC